MGASTVLGDSVVSGGHAVSSLSEGDGGAGDVHRAGRIAQSGSGGRSGTSGSIFSLSMNGSGQLSAMQMEMSGALAVNGPVSARGESSVGAGAGAGGSWISSTDVAEHLPGSVDCDSATEAGGAPSLIQQETEASRVQYRMPGSGSNATSRPMFNPAIMGALAPVVETQGSDSRSGTDGASSSGDGETGGSIDRGNNARPSYDSGSSLAGGRGHDVQGTHGVCLPVPHASGPARGSSSQSSSSNAGASHASAILPLDSSGIQSSGSGGGSGIGAGASRVLASAGGSRIISNSQQMSQLVNRSSSPSG